MVALAFVSRSLRGFTRFGSGFEAGPPHHGKRNWRTNAAVLVVLWLILLIVSLTVLSAVVTPFLRSLQTPSVGSLSWAGYAVSSGLLLQDPVVTGVNGSWVVPNVSVSPGDTYSSAWIGIGGLEDKTLIQVGTEHDSFSGQEVYRAWYELLPERAILIDGMTVSPGDVMTASIDLVDATANNWQIEIVDTTTGQSFRQVFVYASSKLSAEWIVERPNVNNRTSALADFGSVTFTGATAQVGGRLGRISSFPNYEIVMNNLQNDLLASVSPLNADGSSFTVTFHKST